MIKGFFRFEIFNLGIFWGRKILASIFWGSLVYTLSRVFGCIHNNPKIVIVPTYAQPRSAMNKVKPNLLCACLCFLEIFMAWKFSMGFFGGLNFGPGIFLGFDFCLQSIILVTWSPEYSLGPSLTLSKQCCAAVLYELQVSYTVTNTTTLNGGERGGEQTTFALKNPIWRQCVIILSAIVTC